MHKKAVKSPISPPKMLELLSFSITLMVPQNRKTNKWKSKCKRMVVVAAVGVPPCGRAGEWVFNTPLLASLFIPWTELSCLGLGQNGSDEIIESLRVLLWVHGGNLCPSLRWKEHEVNAFIKGFSHAYTLEHEWWTRCLGEIHKAALCTVLLVQVQNVEVILEVVLFHVPFHFFCRKILFLTNHILCKTVHALTSQKTIKCVVFGRNSYELLYNLWWTVKRQAQKSLWDRPHMIILYLNCFVSSHFCYKSYTLKCFMLHFWLVSLYCIIF